MPGSSPLQRPGRPKDPAKRDAIVRTAISLFAQQPYETVTMEGVAGRAGVSKMTVYSHFTDKETLFETVIGAISEEMTRSVLTEAPGVNPLPQRLVEIGTAFLTVVHGPHLTMVHTLPATLRKNPGLATRFYNAGPRRTKAELAAIISDAVAAGDLATRSPDLAAEDLLSLWEGSLPAQIVFGLAAPATPEEIARRARRGTAVFLRAYAAPHSNLQSLAGGTGSDGDDPV